MDPQFVAGRRVYRDQRTLFGGEVGDVIDHKRTEGVGHIVASGVGPGDVQLVHVAWIDLFHRRIVRGSRTTEIVLPGGCLRRTGSGACEPDQNRG